MSGRCGDQEHPARRRTRVSERMRCTGRDEYASSRAATYRPLTAAQIELSLENVENLLDLGVVVSAGIEPWCDGEFEQRTLLGVFCGNQIIDASLMQCDAVGFTVMQNDSLNRHRTFPVNPKQKRYAKGMTWATHRLAAPGNAGARNTAEQCRQAAAGA